MVLSELGEDFPIEGDIGLLQHRHEARVREPHFLKKSIHTNLPETAEVTLLVLPVGEGVRASMEDGFIGLTLLRGATEAVTLHLP